MHPQPYHFLGHEVTLTHGILPSDQLFAGTISGFKYRNQVTTGSLCLTYRYHISRVISLGITAIYEHEKGTWRTHYGLLSYVWGSYEYYGGFNRTCLTFAPEVTFNYGDVAEGKLRLYGIVGAGFTIRQQDSWFNGSSDPGTPPLGSLPDPSRTHLNMQFTPFGMRFGKALGGFFEIGCGYKGIFCYGASYRF